MCSHLKPLRMYLVRISRSLLLHELAELAWYGLCGLWNKSHVILTVSGLSV